MRIRLHHCHQTRSMRVLWLLHEIGVPFDLTTYSFDAAIKTPDFVALSPAGRVPALELDGRPVFESGAMIELLCEAFPDRAMGRAPDDAARADWLIWLHFAETLSQHSAALTQQHVALFEDHMRSPVVMKIEAKRIAKCYGALEARLDQSPYLADGAFSAADVAVGQAVYMARHFARLEDFPKLSEWYARVTKRPAFQASLPPADAARLYAQDFYPPWPVP